MGTFLTDKKYVYYISLLPNKNVGFDSYNLDGEEVYISNRTNKYGEAIKRSFIWDGRRGSRYIKIPATQVDVIDYLDNSPHCAGSPNQGSDVFYKKIDTGKDAEVALSSNEQRVEAENIALRKLEGEKLRQVAILCNEFDENPSIQRLVVTQYAGKNPRYFIDNMYNAPDLEPRAILSIGLHYNVISRKGSLVIWGKEKIGDDIDDAVKTLMGENGILNAIKKELKKLQIAV